MAFVLPGELLDALFLNAGGGGAERGLGRLQCGKEVAGGLFVRLKFFEGRCRTGRIPLLEPLKLGKDVLDGRPRSPDGDGVYSKGSASSASYT